MTIEWKGIPEFDPNETEWAKEEFQKSLTFAAQRFIWLNRKPAHMGITGFVQGGITSIYQQKCVGEVAKELGCDGEEFTPENALRLARYSFIKHFVRLDEDNLERCRIALMDERSNEAIYKLSDEERLNPDILAETLLQVYRDMIREF